MSKTVDSRVVEMRFDNKQFEANVATSMSTLDKLKQKLNLGNSAKGLESIGAAAKKVDMSGLGSGVESVTAKFSALQVMGVTALANITNSAVNAGKRMVKALTIDPVMTGFQEYETKINAVQTIMSNTANKGTTMADVTRVLDELNTYADKTIYNFAEMTRNIGTFTAAGVGLEDSAAAIQGIANLAAMSGSNSQQAATAMYQLSQALASGTVKLMDWNSVVNAGMGGQKFQEALKATAREHGIAVDSIIKKNGSFRDSLQEGWLSAEVLNDTLKKMTVEGAKEYGDAMVKAGKYTQEQADALVKEAQAAEDAATKVKTFTQLWDTTKEAVQSGWAKTWELIIGDFEEAKNLLTPLSDFLNNIINKFSDARNKLLESALGKGFTKMSESLSKMLKPVEKVSEGIDKVGVVSDKVTGSLEDLGVVVDDVILGKFGNGQERFDKLTKSGYNWCEIQNKVNEKLGDSKRYTEEQIAAQDKLLNSQEKTAEATEKTTEETTKLTKEQKQQLKSLVKMSDAQLKAKGYTEEQIKALRELTKTADKLGMPVDEFIDKMDKLNGRMLLINSFKNIGKSITSVFGSIAKAFRAVFEPIKPQQLFDAIAGFHKLTASMVPSAETCEKLTRTFKGLFAVIDLVTSIFGGGLKIAFTILSSVLDGLGLGVLDVTATVGDMVYKFNEWFQNNIFGKFIDAIVEKIPKVIEGIKEFIGSLNIGEGAAETFKTICEGIGAALEIVHGTISRSLNTGLKILGSVLNLFGTNLAKLAEKVAECVIKFRDWIKENTVFIDGINKIAEIIATVIKAIGDLAKKFMALKPVQQFLENFKNTITGFFDRLNFDFDFNGGFLDGAVDAIKDVTARISKWLDTLGDSEHFGRDLVSGLVNGIKSGISTVIGAVINLAKNILNTLCSILGIHSPSTEAKKIGENVIEGLVLGLQNGISKLLNGVKNIGSKLIDFFKNINWSDILVVGSIVTFFVLLNKALNIADKLTKPIEGLSNVLNSFAGVLKSASKWIDAKALETKSNAILNFAKAIGILAASIWVLSKIPVGDLVKATIVLTVLVGLIIALTLVTSKVNKIEGVSFGKLSVLLLSLSLSLILLSAAMKILSGMDPADSTRALLQLVGLIVALTLVVAAYGKFVKADASGNMKKAGQMLMKMAIAIGLLVIVMKIVAGMSWGEIGKGALVIAGAIAMLGAFSLLGNIPNANVSKAGSMLLKMSIAIGILVMVIKLIAGIPAGDITKGLIVIAAIEILFGALMVLSKFAGRNAAKAGGMFLMMSLAIGILALTIKTIAKIPEGDITKSMGVIEGIMILFGALMILSNFVGKNAAKAGAMFLMMSLAIGVLAICIKLIAGIPEGDITKAFGVIMSMEILFMAIMMLSSIVGKNADKAGTMMLKMSLAILVLVGAIALLSILDPADVVRGTLCVSLFLGMFALIMKASEHVTTAYKSLLMMAICIGLLAGAIVALSFLDQNKVIAASLCLSAVLGMFALVVKSSATVTSAMGTLIVLTAAIAVLSGCLYLLAQLPIEQSLGAAASLSMLLLAMSASLLILSKATTVTPMALITLGAMVIAMGLIAAVLGVMQALDIQPSLETAAALSLLLLSLSAACLILAGVGMVAPAALAGALALDGVILVIGGLMVAIGALMEYVPALEGFLDRGIVVLGKIGEGLGQFIGNFAGGIIEGVSSGLPGLGSNLGQFMTNAKPFFDGLSGIDPSVADSAKSLAIAILAITGTNILESLTSWITGGTSMEDFGTQLVGLGKAMKAYAAEVTGIDTGAITSSASAAKGLAEVAKALPKEGGIWQSLAGVQDIGSFGSKLKAFGKGMKQYATEVAGIDTAAITNSASAAKGLTEVAKAIPAEGGIWQSLAGAKDIGSFGSKLKAFGKGMKQYAAEVTGIDSAAITSSVSAAKGLVSVAKTLPKEDGWWQKIAGSGDLSSFGSKIVSFGKSIKQYAAEVTGVGVEGITTSVTAAKKLVSVIKSMNGIETGGVDKFAKAVKNLAKTDMKAVVEAFSGASQAAKLVSAGVKMIKSVGKGMKNQQSSLGSTAKKIASSAATQMSSQTSKFESAGSKLVKALKSGFTKSKDPLDKAAKSMATSAADAVKDKKSSFESAGKALCQGLRNGINRNKSLAVSAARSMANAVAKAARSALKVNSPSKVFIQIGRAVPEGFAKGVEKYGYYVKKSMNSMTDGAIRGTSKAISKIGALLDSDMDVQPTIAPVVDLSNVESGVGAINGMFGRSFGIGATANINAISSMMNKNQNGDSEVVSAINDLKKTLGGMSGDTYYLDGVTYDDGSDVSEAIKTIVRAAKVERRI